MSDQPRQPKIFGIGLSRTGTTSLNEALKILGFRSIHWPTDKTTREHLLRCDLRLPLLETHDALTDIVTVPYFRELDRLYPHSKFILTLRDKASWLTSVERHFAGLTFTEALRKEASFYIKCAVYGCVSFKASHFSDVYDAHVRAVRHHFNGRPDDLLEIDITAGDGWQALCRFLGRPQPDAPFPRTNAG